VVQAENSQDIVSWARAVLARWVPPRVRSRHGTAAERYRTDGLIRLGGLTRLVLART
jgi:hypothetical protein